MIHPNKGLSREIQCMTRSRCGTRYRLWLHDAKHASAVCADSLKQVEECASAEFAGEVDVVKVGGRWEEVESRRQPPK